MYRVIVLFLAIVLLNCCYLPPQNLLPEPVLIEKKLLVKLNDSDHFKYGNISGSGTGFLIHKTKKLNYFLTAQHICTKPEFMDADKLIDAGEGKLKVLTSFILVVDVKNNNKKHRVDIIYEDMVNDICVFTSKIDKAASFSLFELDNSKLKIGDRVKFMGAPQGYFGKDFVYVAEGNYSGKIIVENVLREGYSMAVIYGTSGSPVVSAKNNKIVGMISGFAKDFNNLAWGVESDRLKKVILWVKSLKD